MKERDLGPLPKKKKTDAAVLRVYAFPLNPLGKMTCFGTNCLEWCNFLSLPIRGDKKRDIELKMQGQTSQRKLLGANVRGGKKGNQ